MGNKLLDFLQGASNAAASNVSAPVDGLAWALRKAGINVELFYGALKLEKQFKYAESKNIKYAILMGEAEIQRGENGAKA